MKLPLAILSLPCLAACLSASAEDVARIAFDSFKDQFNKNYETQNEEEKRFTAFKASLDRVAKSGNPSHGITKFSDLTTTEFAENYLSPRPLKKSNPPVAEWDGECTACKRFPEVRNLQNVSSFDWTTKGAVTEVKNQGRCGSCWSFGTTGDIEGTWFLAGHNLTSLSEQELVSCDNTNNACDGGLQQDAFEWVMKHGLTTEENYPYTSKLGIVAPCKEGKRLEIAATIRTWYQVSQSAEGEWKIKSQLPNVGPITIAINAGPMQDYKGGVDDPVVCSKDDLNHAVLVVGFGTDNNGVDYWKIKNSWDADWGEEGYYRIVRGHNKCGLANDAVHSVAKKI